MERYGSSEDEESQKDREPEWISGAAAEKLRIQMWTESLSG